MSDAFIPKSDLEPLVLGLDKLQVEIDRWAEHNFGTERGAFEGIVEELGEYAHARLKSRQGIRGSRSELEAKAKDAIGDLSVFTFDECALRGWSFGRVLVDVW